MSDDQVRINAEKDPTYAPYCLRCRTMERMKIVEPFLWSCACGAICDERVPLRERQAKALDYAVVNLSSCLRDHTDEECLSCSNRRFATEALARLHKDLAYERENIEGVLKLVEEQASIFRVEVGGTLGMKIIGLARGLQMRAEEAEKRTAVLESKFAERFSDAFAKGCIEKMAEAFAKPEHFLDGSCWCDPIVEGNVVKHKGIDSDMPIVSQSEHSKEI